jgi:hypothetical protein
MLIGKLKALPQSSRPGRSTIDVGVHNYQETSAIADAMARCGPQTLTCALCIEPQARGRERDRGRWRGRANPRLAEASGTDGLDLCLNCENNTFGLDG